MPSAAIVPAAGKAARFGGAKLLADVNGAPMLERTIRALLDGGVTDVIVVLAPDSEVMQRRPAIAALSESHVHTVVNPDPSRGMFSSVQCGLHAVRPTARAILVLPGDMPFVHPATVTAVLTAARNSVEPISPAHQGRRGHPLALPSCARSTLLAADARGSLDDVLRLLSLPRREVAVDDPGILRDIDTAADLIGSATPRG
jgi:molybdenum cofactor cytidylyltransferase